MSLGAEAGTYHSSGGVNDLHLLQNRGAVVRDQDFALGRLNLGRQAESSVSLFAIRGALECARKELSRLTILSIPRGPRDVLTTSATAAERNSIRDWAT